LTALGEAASLPLSRFYAHLMKKIGSRLVIRMSAASLTAQLLNRPALHPLTVSLSSSHR
jgi:hypothetical protein